MVSGILFTALTFFAFGAVVGWVIRDLDPLRGGPETRATKQQSKEEP